MKEKYTPEVPTPGVNGQVVGSPALQASRSMLSLAPAATTFGCAASMASAGSFCLFCENTLSLLPTLTSVSPPAWADDVVGTASTSPAPQTTVNSDAADGTPPRCSTDPTERNRLDGHHSPPALRSRSPW